MEKIFNSYDEANCAYLLRNGNVYFEIQDGELYKITGRNLIVAASEIILNFNSDSYYYRSYNLYKDDDSELDEISPKNLKKLIHKYSIGYNLNIFLAKMIKITNEILSKRQSTQTEDVRVVHEIAKTYFDIANSLLDLGKKTKFPDIIQLGERFKNELIFETGKIFSHQKSGMQLEVKKEVLDEFNISYSPNSIICKEGEEGSEMYILNKGMIGVLINENEVARIDKPGTVIGEIALLLGETRTATLRAIDRVVLSIIKKDNLQEFHRTHEDIFLQISETLSKRIYNNFQIIENIDEQMQNKASKQRKTTEKVAGFLSRERAEVHLIDLEKSISDLYEKKGYKELQALVDRLEKSINQHTR
ncbi:MAG: cyclic nucleotide-binding domain-containing protein [Spirochaetota bacterium]|nr:cyclic nucleotide-binding domain-containing protein [Spirochaetota bacterium]